MSFVLCTGLRADGLQPTLGIFDGFTPIRLLQFLVTIKDALDALSKYELTSVSILAYFIKNDNRDAYEAHVNPGTDSSPLAEKWLHVIHLQRFLADAILREAMKSVTIAKQSAGEKETQFALRLLGASRV